MPFDLAEVEIALLNKLKNGEELFCVLSLHDGIIAAITYDSVNEEIKTYHPFDSKIKPDVTPEWAYSFDEIFEELANGAEILYLLDSTYRCWDEIIKTDECFEYNQAGIECYKQQLERIKIIPDHDVENHDIEYVNKEVKSEKIGNKIGELNLKGACYVFSRSNKGYFLTAISKNDLQTYRRFDRVSDLLKFAATLEKDREHKKGERKRNGKER